MIHYLNPRGFLQSAEPYGSKSQFENGASAPKFEPFDKIMNTNAEKGQVETEIGKTATANDKVETKNKKRGRPKGKKQKVDTHHSKIFKPHRVYRLHPNSRNLHI